MTIDPKLIDVQFAFTGYRGAGTDEATYGDEYPDSLLIRKAEWRDQIEQLKEHDKSNSPHPKGCLVAAYATTKESVFNQHPESSCVANAACGAVMRRWNLQTDSTIILSPMSLYCRICTSRHSGSYMLDALEALKTVGVLPSSGHGQQGQYPHVFHENTPFVWPRSLPSGWEETSKHFRCLEWLRIRSLEQFGSALLNQYPVVYGRSGHSIVGEDLVYDGGKFYCRSCDSYGYDNRDGTGRIFDSERMMSSSGAWACRVVTMPDNPREP